ncbi:MAG TPA: septal ring lytic transglycosylase RlpA family protein [Acidimicrobiales bacterium]|nr:septal ring lytic transglycosylase RlpA family protein [Acidimicrobiales bacterium]
MATALLLCAGMAVIPLVALRSGSSAPVARASRAPAASRRQPGAASPVAAAAPVATVLDVEAAAAVHAAAEFSTPLAVAAAAPAASVAPVLPHPASTPAVQAAVAQPAPTPAPAARPVVQRSPLAPVTATSAPTHSAVVARPAATAPKPGEQGLASWYRAPPGTCAHPTLPFGTVLTVTDVTNGRSVTCRVDDRGPYASGRVVDLSPDVFARLAPLGAGVAVVRVTW